jgi:hypothetical protein
VDSALIGQSLVEQKILHDLGVSSLPNWHSTGPRTRFQPRTQPAKSAKIQEELQRMKAYADLKGGTVDSIHLRGEPMEVDKLLRYPMLESPRSAEESNRLNNINAGIVA